MSYLKLAQEEGGTFLTGGHALHPAGLEGGLYIEPTIIEGLPADCRTNKEEIFGPVVTIMPFDTEEEVMAYANGTDYGLSATVWTSHLGRAHRVARDLEAGIVWINTWLFDALKFFTEQKNVCIDFS